MLWLFVVGVILGTIVHMSKSYKIILLALLVLGACFGLYLTGSGTSSNAEYIKCSQLTTPESYVTCMKTESGDNAREALLRLYENKNNVEIDSRCHDVVHAYGRELWRDVGLRSFDLGVGVMELCQYGALHSFLFESGADFNEDDFKEFIMKSIIPRCGDFDNGKNLFIEQCYHGIGHAIASSDGSTTANYVLDFCDIAPGKGGVESCVRGAVMEMTWPWINSDRLAERCDGYVGWDVVCRQIVYAAYYGEFKFKGLEEICSRSENDALGCAIGIGQQLVREINSSSSLEDKFGVCIDLTDQARDNGEIACIDAFSRSLLQYTGSSAACQKLGKYSEACFRVGSIFKKELLGPDAPTESRD